MDGINYNWWVYGKGILVLIMGFLVYLKIRQLKCKKEVVEEC